MSTLAVGYISLLIVVIFLFSSMPIGFAMMLVGFMGMIYLTGLDSALNLLATVPYSSTASYTLSVVPLFVLMGQLAYWSGISRDFYQAVYKWLGHLPGGLAMATIGACAGFASVCGSSLATAATMGTVALPEMEKYKYDPSLATGSVAAGGTLGILIPPSVGFIIYAMLTKQSIGALFMAGILPGILLALLFMATIYILALLNPRMGPRGSKTSFMEKIKTIKDVWAVLVLFVVVIGGIYVGIFTPTEAAGVGAAGALSLALAKRQLSWKNFSASLAQTGRTTAMVFLIVIGAMIFGYFLAVTRVPAQLSTFITTTPLPPVAILVFTLLFYLCLGCIMDSLAMILLTVPIVYPTILALGFDPIWFGVILVIVMEMGLITPPVGLNVYIISGVSKTPLHTIFRGILPFLAAMILCIVILIFFPEIALFLPNLTW